MTEFTHFDKSGNASMVDVGGKRETVRTAVAVGRIRMSRECYDMVRAGTAAKGDVLAVARIAGIMAAKKTPDLIPLCHALSLDKVSMDFSFNNDANEIEAACMTKCTGATGVEMEALTGVSVALLCIYDMCKAVDKAMEITSIRLLEKTGGYSGDYKWEEPPCL